MFVYTVSMCGGFSIFNLTDDKLISTHNKLANVLPRPLYNARPGQFLPVVVNKQGKNSLESAFWGIHPVWAKSQLINAKAETLFTSKYWRRMTLAYRCLIPANGFFEWRADPGGKVPFFYRDAKRKQFYMAGVYDLVKKDKGYQFINFAIITTAANQLVGKIHDRMPVILAEAENAKWLSPDTSEAALAKLLDPYPASQMKGYEVSPAVNNARNNSEDLIYPLKP